MANIKARSYIKARSFNDILNDMYGTLGIGQQQQISSGQGTTASGQSVANGTTIDPYANIFGNAGSPLDPQVLKKLLQGYTVGLTPQEAEELEVLRKEYELAIKAAKIAAFKKIAPEMRQWVINGLTWQEEINIINNTTADKSQRMQELEGKNNVGFGPTLGSAGWYSPSAPGFNPYSSHATIPFMIPLPEGLSAEDLKQAHVEATMEEEMLNGQEESKT